MNKGVTEIMLIALPWNARGFSMPADDLTINGALAPFLRIKDWSTVCGHRDLAENGVDLLGVWTQVLLLQTSSTECDSHENLAVIEGICGKVMRTLCK